MPVRTAPKPPPPGLPPCVALGAYAGPLRGLILAYKEKGAFRLARPLGVELSRAAAIYLDSTAVPVVIVPVPSTAAAIRTRHGDHMIRLARQVVRELRRRGIRSVVANCLTAAPKVDSSHLTAAARARSAATAFRVRSAAVARVAAAQRVGAAVIIVDDILTTGATIAAVSNVLWSGGVVVDGAACVAATRRLHEPSTNTIADAG